MKKIYLILGCVAMAVAANAQNVKFYYGNSEIPQNGTFEFHDVEESEFGGYIIEPAITLRATNNQTVRMVANCLTGQSINLCFGGDCGLPGPTVTSPAFTMMGGVSYDLRYDLTSDDPINYEVTSEMTVYDDITDAVINKITVKFTPNSGAVNGISADNLFNYQQGTFTYNVSGAENFALYTASGQMVKNLIVEGKGQISTSGLLSGIYVYTIGNKSGKIIIK